MVKILHLTHDDKFIDMAYETYEKVFPGQNTVWVFTKNDDFKYIKNKSFRKLNNKMYFDRNIVKEIAEYDCVVLHTLLPPFIWTILRSPKHIKYIWKGWGFDYYDLMHDDSSALFLPKTAALRDKLNNKKGPIWQAYRFFGKIAKKTIFRYFKLRAIEKVRIFAPVLPEEHTIIAKRHNINPMPKYMSWNYGNLEDDLIKGFEGMTVSGDNIMVGNSATPTNNHLDAFEFLEKIDTGKKKILVPLTYGDDQYLKEILPKGHEMLGEGFEPMTDYLPTEEYVAIIRSCGFVIMNHVRQQALCNIVIMMYLGAKIFLRAECPTYDYFKNQGAIIFSVQELQADPSLLETPLTAEQIEQNRTALQPDRASASILKKTEELINTAVNMDNR